VYQTRWGCQEKSEDLKRRRQIRKLGEFRWVCIREVIQSLALAFSEYDEQLLVRREGINASEKMFFLFYWGSLLNLS